MAKMGRPTDAVKHKFQMILEKSDAHERFLRILKQTKDEKNFLKAYEMACDRAYGKPEQSMEVSGLDGPSFGVLSAGAISQVLETLKKGSD